jgi:hypothetical protein
VAIDIFTGNVLAIIWDFDQTLIPGYQQAPLFEEYSINSGEFWQEVSALEQHYRKQGVLVCEDTLYLNHILSYVEAGRMPGLTNMKLAELGARLKFYPGLPDFLPTCKRFIEDDPRFAKHSIRVEHYVVSTGLRRMIAGSAVGPHLTTIWACEFIEDPAQPGFLRSPVRDTTAHPVKQVGYFLDNTTKTRAIWEINKGCNIDEKIRVNDLIAQADRRVPLRNMLYVADGPSDVPVCSILNQYGGRRESSSRSGSSERSRRGQLPREVDCVPLDPRFTRRYGDSGCRGPRPAASGACVWTQRTRRLGG